MHGAYIKVKKGYLLKYGAMFKTAYSLYLVSLCHSVLRPKFRSLELYVHLVVRLHSVVSV